MLPTLLGQLNVQKIKGIFTLLSEILWNKFFNFYNYIKQIKINSNNMGKGDPCLTIL